MSIGIDDEGTPPGTGWFSYIHYVKNSNGRWIVRGTYPCWDVNNFLTSLEKLHTARCCVDHDAIGRVRK